jgi:hypothetical protein
MQRIIDVTAAATPPTVPVLSGPVGYFTEGVPGISAATRVRAWWTNMVQEEIMSVLVAAGVTPDTTGTNLAQLLAAINALIGTGTSAEAAARAAAISAEATARAAADAAEATARVAGDATETAARVAAVAALFSSVSNVTASRALATNYTNATGRPMFVSVQGITAGANSNFNFTINGVQTASMGQDYTSSNVFVCGLVPAGFYYQAWSSVAPVTVQNWLEIY